MEAERESLDMTMKIEGQIVNGYLKALSGLEQLPGPEGERSIELFRHGTLTVKLYAPRGNDHQTPHTRDEIYVIASGSGRFRRTAEETSFGAGDVLFVAAGEEHQFIEFSEDFATWVFFYGPEGGEAEVVKTQGSSD
jgi:mannose-6-phosphate isomerase-like protein (cupin superfamily)